MTEIKGKHNTAKVFTDEIEQGARDQIQALCDCEAFKDSKIRMMPDVHAGKGCCIGTTMTLTDRVVPGLVGVDIGCLDKETEVLTPDGWIKIADYNNQQILLYEPWTDRAFFKYPNAFIKAPCSEFYHFSNSKNLDQVFSADHHMIVFEGYKNDGFTRKDYYAEDFVNRIKNLKKADYYTAKATFNIEHDGISLSDDYIRLFVMVSADGRIKRLASGKSYIELHFKKDRKIERAKMLLESAGLQYTENRWKNGSTCIRFTDGEILTKELSHLYAASKHQLQVICDEVLMWDGCICEKYNHRYYCSTSKKNADFVQYAFSATGTRATICTKEFPKNQGKWKPLYYVIPTKNEYVGYRVNPEFLNKVQSEDGFKYCFNTDTGAFVIRRRDCISVTGNCGMLARKISNPSIDFDLLEKVIRSQIPSGRNVRDKAIYAPEDLKDALLSLRCLKSVDMDYALRSLGTLGGGNHFIEVDKGKDSFWIVIHSGSRHLGLEIAEHYQDIAHQMCNTVPGLIRERIAQLKAEGRQKDIQAEIERIKRENLHEPGELDYVSGSAFSDYIHDMRVAQKYAMYNRWAMMAIICHAMEFHVTDEFETVHNYIDTDAMILRKGSVSARDGERILIPMNMRDGSLICTGKGNPDWNFSAPHGAGRLMSRAQAKKLSMDDYRASMKGIWTASISEETLDECPMAYKSMESILSNIRDTADVKEIIKPVYNYKAKE